MRRMVASARTDDNTLPRLREGELLPLRSAQGRSVAGGWLGRHLRLRAGKKMTPLSAVAIGPTIPESLRGAPSASAMWKSSS